MPSPLINGPCIRSSIEVLVSRPLYTGHCIKSFFLCKSVAFLMLVLYILRYLRCCWGPGNTFKEEHLHDRRTWIKYKWVQHATVKVLSLMCQHTNSSYLSRYICYALIGRIFPFPWPIFWNILSYVGAYLERNNFITHSFIVIFPGHFCPRGKGAKKLYYPYVKHQHGR